MPADPMRTKPRVHRINHTDPEHLQMAAQTGSPWFAILGVELADDFIISNWGRVYPSWSEAMVAANDHARKASSDAG